MKRAWSTFWLIAGGSMLIAGLWVPWFVIDFTYFKMSVGWFGVVYGILGLYYNYKLSQTLQLTPRELHDHGQTLTRLAPMIVDRLKRGTKPKALAVEIEKSEGVPVFVTLKFMLALSHEAPELLAKAPKEKPNGSDLDGKAKTEDK